MLLKFHFEHFQLCPQGDYHNGRCWNIIPCEQDSRISNLDVWPFQLIFFSFRHMTNSTYDQVVGTYPVCKLGSTRNSCWLKNCK